MKTIETTYGHIEITDEGEYIYHGGQTDNGWCFKDYAAWNEGKGIIYISEYQLQDIENGEGEPSWTRELWEQEVAERLSCEYPEEIWSNKEFVSALAFYVLMICDWQDLTTSLEEMTYGNDIENMFNREGFFSNIE